MVIYKQQTYSLQASDEASLLLVILSPWLLENQWRNIKPFRPKWSVCAEKVPGDSEGLFVFKDSGWPFWSCTKNVNFWGLGVSLEIPAKRCILDNFLKHQVVHSESFCLFVCFLSTAKTKIKKILFIPHALATTWAVITVMSALPFYSGFALGISQRGVWCRPVISFTAALSFPSPRSLFCAGHGSVYPEAWSSHPRACAHHCDICAARRNHFAGEYAQNPAGSCDQSCCPCKILGWENYLSPSA